MLTMYDVELNDVAFQVLAISDAEAIEFINNKFKGATLIKNGEVLLTDTQAE